MNVNAVNTNAINWESLLGKLGEVEKTTSPEGKDIFTVSMKVGDETRTYSFGIPDDLEAPATVDQAAIDTLCAKLSADKETFNLSDNDIATLKKSLTDVLSSVTSAADINTNSKSVMFDLYQLMALLVEVAQKQRDSAREQRLAENTQIQTSILAQAEQQRTAAWVSMIASVACCAIQLGFSLYTMKQEGAAYKSQMSTLETSGVNDAKTQFSQKATALKDYQANVMADAKNGVPLTPEARQAKIDTMKQDLARAGANLDRAQNIRSTDSTYLQAARNITKYQAYNNIISSLGNLGQNIVQGVNTIMQSYATEKEVVRRKEEEQLDQTKDLFGQAQNLIDQVVQLIQAINSAETQSMRDAIQA